MKQSTCKVCGIAYTKSRPLQKVCSPVCAVKHARKVSEKKQAKEVAQDRARTREKLKALMTRPELVRKAQAAFNGFIRARDVGKTCISCDKPLGTEPNTYDAGHFRSVGSAPHMRFVEDNVHGQCKHCNNYLGGNHVEYRKRLIDKIGADRVQQIEGDTTVRKYTREALEEMARYYRAEARKLKGNK